MNYLSLLLILVFSTYHISLQAQSPTFLPPFENQKSLRSDIYTLSDIEKSGTDGDLTAFTNGKRLKNKRGLEAKIFEMRLKELLDLRNDYNKKYEKIYDEALTPNELRSKVEDLQRKYRRNRLRLEYEIKRTFTRDIWQDYKEFLQGCFDYNSEDFDNDIKDKNSLKSFFEQEGKTFFEKYSFKTTTEYQNIGFQIDESNDNYAFKEDTKYEALELAIQASSKPLTKPTIQLQAPSQDIYNTMGAPAPNDIPNIDPKNLKFRTVRWFPVSNAVEAELFYEEQQEGIKTRFASATNLTMLINEATGLPQFTINNELFADYFGPFRVSLGVAFNGVTGSDSLVIVDSNTVKVVLDSSAVEFSTMQRWLSGGGNTVVCVAYPILDISDRMKDVYFKTDVFFQGGFDLPGIGTISEEASFIGELALKFDFAKGFKNGVLSFFVEGRASLLFGTDNFWQALGAEQNRGVAFLGQVKFGLGVASGVSIFGKLIFGGSILTDPVPTFSTGIAVTPFD